jgi:hypothetical protein
LIFTGYLCNLRPVQATSLAKEDPFFPNGVKK